MTTMLRSETDLTLVIDLLRELTTEVRALRADLQRPHRQRKALSRADRALLTRLLPAIAGAVGPELFTVNELLRDSSPALRIVLEGVKASNLGRLLRRALDVPIDGLMITSDSTEDHRRLWQIVKVI